MKDEALAVPAGNPLMTPQKGNTLDHSLHKDLLGAISGIGNAFCSYQPCPVSLKLSLLSCVVNGELGLGLSALNILLVWCFTSEIVQAL